MSSATGTYFDGETAAGEPVTLEFIDAQMLRIESSAGPRDFLVADVTVSDRLGNIPRFVYLPNRALVETADNEFVDAGLAGRRQSPGAQLIHFLESQHWVAVLGCFVLVAALVVLGVFGPPALARIVANRVPADIEQRIGSAALAGVEPYFSRSTLTLQERARVEQQLVRVQPDARLRKIRLEFRSMNGQLPNAFALPGGIIVMTDELVRLPATDDEIAAVLAHELGHLQYRHGLQSVLRNSITVLIVAAVTGDVSTLTSFAASIPMTILTAGYSRDLEREADRYALAVMQRRGVPKHAFVQLMVKLESGQPRVSTYLSTHPATEERTALFGGITLEDRRSVLIETWLAGAKTALHAGNFATAESLCDNAITMMPTAPGYLLRAQSRLGRKEFAAAEADLAKAIQLNPKLVEAHVLQAETLAHNLRRYNDAIAAADRALALDPNNVSALATRGFAQMETGHFDTIGPEFDRAIQDAPTDYHGWAYRGVLNLHRRKWDAAVADFDQAVKLAPLVEWIRLQRGIARSQTGNAIGALADFDAIKAPSLQTPWYYLERANAELQLGQNTQSVSDLGKALQGECAPNLRLQVLLTRASAYVRVQDYPSALSDCDAAIVLNPKNAWAYYERASILDRSDRPDRALEDIDAAARAGLPEKVFLRERARIESKAGQDEKALTDFTRIIEQNPKEIFAYRGRGLIELASAQYARADADFGEFAARATGESQVYGRFCQLLARRSQGVDDHQDELAADIWKWQGDWIKTVGRYLCGEITESEILAQLDAGKTPSPSQRRCEAWFYIGMNRLIGGDKASAQEFFRKCIATGERDYIEYQVASGELRRLSTSNP